MNQIECLTRSIEDKWIPIVEGRHKDGGNEDCACCEEYCCCEGCPIYEDTKKTECGGTFYTVYYWLRRASIKNYDLIIEAKAAATAELEYLIDLRERLK